jgi:hypothetical protein
VAVVLAAGCATSGAIGVGPTIDGDGVVRIEGNAGTGPVTDNGIIALDDPQRGPIGIWAFGVRVAVGIGTRLSRTQSWFGGYVEYVRLGSSSSPWGFHTSLTVGMTLDHGGLFAALSGGPDRISSATWMDSNDGRYTVITTNGADLSLRGQFHLAEGEATSPWQLSASYIRQSAHLYP